MFDMAHGAGLAIMFPAWLRHISGGERDARIAKLGEAVFGVTGECVHCRAKATIAAFIEYFRSLGLAVKLSECGIDLTEEQVEELTDKVLCFGAKKGLGQFAPLTRKDIEEIYRDCK